MSRALWIIVGLLLTAVIAWAMYAMTDDDDARFDEAFDQRHEALPQAPKHTRGGSTATPVAAEDKNGSETTSDAHTNDASADPDTAIPDPKNAQPGDTPATGGVAQPLATDQLSLDELRARINAPMDANAREHAVKSLMAHVSSMDRTTSLDGNKLLQTYRAQLTDEERGAFRRVLRSNLGSDDFELAASAIQGLLALSDEQQLDDADASALLRLARRLTASPLYRVPQYLVAQAKGDLRGELGIPLLTYLNTNDAEAHLETLNAMARIHQLSNEIEARVMKLAMSNDHPDVRAAAVKLGLGRADPKTWPMVDMLIDIALAKDDPDCTSARDALTLGIRGALESRLADRLVERLPTLKDRRTWSWAVKTISRHGAIHHVGPLQNTLATPDLPKWVSMAIQNAVTSISKRHRRR